jgi:hypothetical protein
MQRARPETGLAAAAPHGCTVLPCPANGSMQRRGVHAPAARVRQGRAG